MADAVIEAASRDRLKDGEESRKLRRKLTAILTVGRLKEIYKERKSAITVESKDTQDLLQNFTRNLPLQSDLVRLLSQTFELNERRSGDVPTKRHAKPSNHGKQIPAFHAQRFPSFFKIEQKSDSKSGIPMVKVPLGSERAIRFSTDVEDQYFDRVSEPGELQIALLDMRQNDTTGGTRPSLPDRIEGLLNVVKSSPDKGTIRVTVNPTETVRVGNTIKLRADLSGPGQNFEEIFWLSGNSRSRDL